MLSPAPAWPHSLLAPTTITQYLAGGLVLLDRYQSAPPTTRVAWSARL
jgi:hypothetical protein